MYLEGEVVITTANIGKEGTELYVPKGSEVEFIRSIETTDMSKQMVMVKHGDRALCVSDLVIRKQDIKAYKKAMDKLNRDLARNNPRLGLHHSNFFIRLYYRIKLLFIKAPKTSTLDVQKLKKLIQED
jgi:hypothetical protein